MNPNIFPEHPNREFIRNFKKKYGLSKASNAEIKQIIANLKTTEKREMLNHLNDPILSINKGE